jgi:hypothetical protein
LLAADCRLPTAKGVAVFKKMLEDKKVISKHLKSGGTFDQLKKKGYRFATISDCHSKA